MDSRWNSGVSASRLKVPNDNAIKLLGRSLAQIQASGRIQQFRNADNALLRSSMSATGAHKFRTITLGVIEFITRLINEMATAVLICQREVPNHTARASQAITTAYTAAAIRMTGGRYVEAAIRRKFIEAA